jgi:hypothetical protein
MGSGPPSRRRALTHQLRNTHLVVVAGGLALGGCFVVYVVLSSG